MDYSDPLTAFWEYYTQMLTMFHVVLGQDGHLEYGIDRGCSFCTIMLYSLEMLAIIISKYIAHIYHKKVLHQNCGIKKADASTG